jgi:hypothetical protein
MVKIDPEFKRHLLSLSPIELSFLEDSIISEGCREPLVVWKEQGVLVDGHHRYDICTRHSKPFTTVEMSFGDRESVLDWMDKNQIARRNCDPKDAEIIRGRIYNRRKKSHGGDHKASGQVGHLISPPNTAQAVAAELDISPRTVRRSGKRAEVYDALLNAGDDQAAQIARSATREQIEEVHGKPAKEVAEELKTLAREGVPKRVKPSKAEVKNDKPKNKPKHPGEHNQSEVFAYTNADVAVNQLKSIPATNKFRDAAFDRVITWIDSQRSKA